MSWVLQVIDIEAQPANLAKASETSLLFWATGLYPPNMIRAWMWAQDRDPLSYAATAISQRSFQNNKEMAIN